jgi:hypothetical protein
MLCELHLAEKRKAKKITKSDFDFLCQEVAVDSASDTQAVLFLAWKRGQEPIAKWPEGCFALLVPDPFSRHEH